MLRFGDESGGPGEGRNVRYETIWLQTRHPVMVPPSANRWAVLLLCYLGGQPHRPRLTCRITARVFNPFQTYTSLAGCRIISCVVIVRNYMYPYALSWSQLLSLCHISFSFHHPNQQRAAEVSDAVMCDNQTAFTCLAKDAICMLRRLLTRLCVPTRLWGRKVGLQPTKSCSDVPDNRGTSLSWIEPWECV